MQITLRACWPDQPAEGVETVFLSQVVERNWPELPHIGDTVMLDDGSDHGQDVSVVERVFERDGSVCLWVGRFGGWTLDNVKAIGFEGEE